MRSLQRAFSPGVERKAAVAERDIPDAANNSPRPRPRVLVVDDEPLIRWSIAQTLTEQGWEVVETADRATTLRALEDEPPFDVVMLDYRLPDSNDFGLLTAVRRIMPRAQVILMTAFSAPEITQGAMRLGAFSVVAKPFEIGYVAALVGHARAARR